MCFSFKPCIVFATKNGLTGNSLSNRPLLVCCIILSETTTNRQQMYDFLPWTCICGTCGEGKRRRKEQGPQMVANYGLLRVKVRTKELIIDREMKHSQERPGKSQSWHVYYLPAFVQLEGQESGIIGNSLEKRGGRWYKRMSYLNNGMRKESKYI